jgi:hypothetical protein
LRQLVRDQLASQGLAAAIDEKVTAILEPPQ